MLSWIQIDEIARFANEVAGSSGFAGVLVVAVVGFAIWFGVQVTPSFIEVNQARSKVAEKAADMVDQLPVFAQTIERLTGAVEQSTSAVLRAIGDRERHQETVLARLDGIEQTQNQLVTTMRIMASALECPHKATGGCTAAHISLRDGGGGSG